MYHDGRFYETDGQQAIGIHDVSKIRLLSPIGTPPSVRFFGRTPTERNGFHYVNPSGIRGPLAELVMPFVIKGLCVRVAGVVAEAGQVEDVADATRALLGVTLLVSFYDDPFTDDLPFVCGPFLWTLDDLGTEPRQLTVKCGDATSTSTCEHPVIPPLLVASSWTMPLASGDLIASPPLHTEPICPELGRITVQWGDLSPLHFTLS